MLRSPPIDECLDKRIEVFDGVHATDCEVVGPWGNPKPIKDIGLRALERSIHTTWNDGACSAISSFYLCCLGVAHRDYSLAAAIDGEKRCNPDGCL